MSQEPLSSSDDQQRIEALERENAALRRVNARLARERIGSAHTAAAAQVAPAAKRKRRAPGIAIRARRAVRRVALRVLR